LSVQQEEAAKRLEGKLIAPCCFSQTVANHYSDVAAHMKQQIRQFLAQGQREDQILDAYVRVYGERILAEPQARGFNLLAYLAPPLATVAGMGGLLFMLRQWRRSAFMHQLIRQQPVARQDENFQFYRARLRDELERFSG
jgi:cytochrome c-type biogenesis protein CcmH